MPHSISNLSQTGFNLIELLMVMAIIGILAAIAYPSYLNDVQKGRRSDAMTALMQEASLQEKYAIQNGGNYTGNNTLLGNATSTNGYYNITINTTNCGTAPCFQITATATGAQAKDTKCSQILLNNLGNITSKDSAGGNSTGSC